MNSIVVEKNEFLKTGSLQLDLFSPELWPKKPYCTDHYENGIAIRSFNHAVKKRYIQPNPPHLLAQMVFDLDFECAGLQWEKANLAMPSWIAVNRQNGHAHLSYMLRVPVLFESEKAHRQAIRYAQAVQYAYTAKLEADRAYGGLICKNPNHSFWKVFKGSKTLYELHDLAEYVELPKKIPWQKKEDTFGLGRNESIFDFLRFLAYRELKSFKYGGFSQEKWKNHLENLAIEKNAEFVTPLSPNEIRHIAKSVAKWTWSKWDIEASDRKFTQLQAYRGKKGGLASGVTRLGASEEKRLEALKMHKGGLKVTQIAKELEVPIRTVYSWVKKCAMKP